MHATATMDTPTDLGGREVWIAALHGRLGRAGTMDPMSDDRERLTTLIGRVDRGDADAAGEMLELVYTELRRVAGHLMKHEKPGQTIGATALVHEAYLRLAESEGLGWEDSRHFFNAAAMAMRRCLIDRARRKGRIKHGGDEVRVELDVVEIPASALFKPEEFEAVHTALEDLAAHNPRWSEVVNLRVFLGLGVQQTAETLGVSASTIKNDTRFSIAWLKAHLAQRAGGDKGEA